ncbi:MAG: SigE family RNA polymerase sigma factor [Jatrophihabitans sp.]
MPGSEVEPRWRERGQVQAGESFDDFVRREQAGLVRYAALLTGSRAQGEDLVQDVLVRVYLRWEQVSQAHRDALAYVRRAVTNEHVSWRRRWSTRQIGFVAPEDLPARPVPPSDQPDEQLWACLQQLPRQQRAAVVLRYYEGLTDPEIGEVLGCRPGSVRAHVSRGLATLRLRTGLPERGE